MSDQMTACGRCGALVPKDRDPCPTIADCVDMLPSPKTETINAQSSSGTAAAIDPEGYCG